MQAVHWDTAPRKCPRRDGVGEANRGGVYPADHRCGLWAQPLGVPGDAIQPPWPRARKLGESCSPPAGADSCGDSTPHLRLCRPGCKDSWGLRAGPRRGGAPAGEMLPGSDGEERRERRPQLPPGEALLPVLRFIGWRPGGPLSAPRSGGGSSPGGGGRVLLTANRQKASSSQVRPKQELSGCRPLSFALLSKRF